MIKASHGPKKAYRQRQLGAIASRWDKRAAQWDTSLNDPLCHLNEDDAYNRFLRLARRLIRQRREFCAQHGIVDAGCGTGLVLAELIPFFAWGVGIDISEKMIQLAAARKIPRARLRVADCFRMGRLRPKAGAVVSRGVLLSHYGQNLGTRLLRSAQNALKPGGFALFDFLNEESKLNHFHIPQGKMYFTGHQALSMAQAAGFSKAAVHGAAKRRVLLLVAEV